MTTVSPLLGRKFSAGRLRRHRETIARLKQEGRKFGAPLDPETRFEERVCELPSCRKRFPFKITKGFNPKVNAGRYCCQPHALQHTAIIRRKCPANYELLYDLYVSQNMSTEEIAEMFGTQHHSVCKRLAQVGIPRRKIGHSRHTVCSEVGCDVPVLKLKHPQNGSMYGTKCFEHYWAHRKFLYTSRYERIKKAKGDIPTQILRAMASGLNTSQDIAKRIGVTTKAVSASMRYLKERGAVVDYGTVTVNHSPQKLWRLAKQAEAIAC